MISRQASRHKDGPRGDVVGVEDRPAGVLRGRKAYRALAFGISAAFIVGFLYLVYGFVFSNGLCCADDAFIATAAKNLALGHGYATSVPHQGIEGLQLFDPWLSTGPTLVFPAAALIKLFGATPWAPGLATALVTTLLLVVLTVFVGRRVGLLRGVTYLALMLALQYTLTAGPRFAQWYSLLGEVPAAILTVLGIAILAWGRGGRRKVAWAFLALGLAFITKSLALLGAVPVGLWLVVLIVRSRGRNRHEWIDLTVGAGSFIAPFLMFEAWKAVSLGRDKYLTNVKDSITFLSTTGAGGGGADSASLWKRIVANSAVLRDNYGFGPLLLVLLVVALGLLVRASADQRTKIFCWLTLAGGLTELLYFVTWSKGNPRYALIGLLLLAAGAACVVMVDTPARAVVATAVVVALSCWPANSRLLAPVTFPPDGLFRPNQRVQNLQSTAKFLTGIHRNNPLVGSWWATVDELEYSLPTVSNFVSDGLGDMRDGRLLARNEFWVNHARSPNFTKWEQTCDKVIFEAPPYLVTQCPTDPRPQ